MLSLSYRQTGSLDIITTEFIPLVLRTEHIIIRTVGSGNIEFVFTSY